MAKQMIIGNWKMYKTEGETEQFLKELIPQLAGVTRQVGLAVPFTSIKKAAVAAKAAQSPLLIGAQNMHDVSEGAYTGEIALPMLLDEGAQFVLLGHSERRQYFGEDNAFINRKVLRALESGKLEVVLCIGESLEEREAGQTAAVLSEQLQACLAGINPSSAAQLWVAYEPVWAIGSGKKPSSEEIGQAASAIGAKLKEQLSAEAAKVGILYGGSVSEKNAKEILNIPEISGVLVGGASLNAGHFLKILQA